MHSHYKNQENIPYRSKFAQEMSRYVASRSPGRDDREDPLTHFNIYREL
jgi:hypothetical protein